MTQPPVPGWYQDPHNELQRRFWDGNAWTEHVQAAPAPTGPPQPTTANVMAGPASGADRAWPRRHPGWSVFIVLLLVLVVAGVAGSGSDGGSNGTDANTDILTATTPPVAPHIVLNETGNGQGQTDNFAVADEWSISYSYDCANFGMAGNFQIYVEGSDDSASLSNSGANELGSSGASVIHNHHGGVYYLTINSECQWQITVTSGD